MRYTFFVVVVVLTIALLIAWALGALHGYHQIWPLFGLALVFTPGIIDWSAVWPWTKAAAVLGMTWFHHWLMIRRKDFMRGTNSRTGRDYRIMNEVPTVLLLVIVFSVVLKF